MTPGIFAQASGRTELPSTKMRKTTRRANFKGKFGNSALD